MVFIRTVVTEYMCDVISQLVAISCWNMIILVVLPHYAYLIIFQSNGGKQIDLSGLKGKKPIYEAHLCQAMHDPAHVAPMLELRLLHVSVSLIINAA